MAIRDLFRGGPKAAKGLPARAFVLGLDWGTSTSKLVLRDYDDRDFPLGCAYVLQHPHLGNTVRYPSTVVVREGCVYFGAEADRRFGNATPGQRWSSLKMAMLAARKGDHAEQVLPDLGVSLADLAVASIAHLVLLGRFEADRLARARKRRAEVEVMLGMPVTRASDSKGAWYASLAQRALRMADEVGVPIQPYGALQGMPLRDLRELAERARLAVADAPVQTDDFVRAELAAALFWPYRNPETQEGLYTAVDFGAGTVNISFYRLARVATQHGWVRRGQISFYAGQCTPPGCDQIDQAIAETLGKSDANVFRGVENKYLAQHPQCEKPVDAVIAKMVHLWGDTRISAFSKEPVVSRWNDIRVLLIGGGSNIQRIRDAFQTNPHKSARGVRMVGKLPPPQDLFRLPHTPNGRRKRFRGDTEILYVAYGLSVRPGDFAKIHPSDTVKPLRRPSLQVRDLDPESLGYSDK